MYSPESRRVMRTRLRQVKLGHLSLKYENAWLQLPKFLYKSLDCCYIAYMRSESRSIHNQNYLALIEP